MRRIIASVDIGTSSIKCVVGEIKGQKLNVLAAAESSSEGIKKGLIVDSNQALASLKTNIKKIEELLNLKITKAICSVPTLGAEFMIGEGSSTITNPENIVGNADVIMTLQASVYNKVPTNMELITVIPTVFKLDNEELVKDPKGHITKKLSVKSVIVMTPKKNVTSVTNLFEKCGIKVVDVFLSGLGDYYSHKTEKFDEGIGAVINLGYETTTVSIFNKGVLTNTEVIDLGAKNIDNDFCFIYKIEKKDAKNLRENLALCHKRMADAAEHITLTTKLGDEIQINQYEISEIMMSRLSEIMELAKKQINLLTKKEISYIIYSGGLTEAKDFNILLESIYGHSATLGSIKEIGARDNKYSTSLGMIKAFSEFLDLKGKDFSIWNAEELEELSNANTRINIADNSLLGKIFGYFFDN